MYNPFIDDTDQTDDRVLVQTSIKGDRVSLEKLIVRHQPWIYNIALKMVMNPDDAADVTQEILIKMITGLSTYDPLKSRFRTWLYRILANHVISMNKRKWELRFSDLDEYAASIDNIPDDRTFTHPDAEVLVQELRISCVQGMLLCLSRTERLAFILGVIFNVPDTVGGELLEISRMNFRKILSRSRKKLHHFMDDNCGLINENSRCKCSNKVKAMAKYYDPQNPKYFKKNVPAIADVIEVKMAEFEDSYYAPFLKIFREQPFCDPPDLIAWLRATLQKSEFKDMFRL